MSAGAAGAMGALDFWAVLMTAAPAAISPTITPMLNKKGRMLFAPGTVCLVMQQCLYFLPLPHGHGSFRPITDSMISAAFLVYRVYERSP
jgi:hypothetical protein